MAEKDIAEKTLIAIDEVFADIVNVLLFGGKTLVKPEDLAATTATAYQASGTLREQERDVAKHWRGKCGFRIALFGIENETVPEDDMPFRVIGYDGAEYRDQLYSVKDEEGKRRRNQNPRYAVVTLVLYFGYQKRWDKAKTLYENIGSLPEELKPYVHDFKINLFEIAYLTDEQAALFKSDFRIVVDYFIQMRKTGRYVPRFDQVAHPYEILHLMSALSRDNRFVEAYNELEKENREITKMSEALDWIEQQGERRGRIMESVGIYREEMNMDDSAIVRKLTAHFDDLTEEQAWEYVAPKKSA